MTTIIKSKKIASRVIKGETFIVTPFDSTLHMLNPLGTKIWQLLDERNTIEEIVTKICEEYEVSKEEARKDIQEFVDELKKKKIIEKIT